MVLLISVRYLYTQLGLATVHSVLLGRTSLLGEHRIDLKRVLEVSAPNSKFLIWEDRTKHLNERSSGGSLLGRDCSVPGCYVDRERAAREPCEIRRRRLSAKKWDGNR